MLASRGALRARGGASGLSPAALLCNSPLLLVSRPPSNASSSRRAARPPAATTRRGTMTTSTSTSTSSGRAKPGTATTSTGTTTATRGRGGGTTAAKTTGARGRSRQRSPSPARLSDAERNDPERGERGPGRGYFNFTGFPFPLGPYFERRTTRSEIVKDTVWTFEQTQAIDFFAVYTPVRMTVIRLASTGGLWVHAPVAPTQECLRLLRDLDAPVEHIVLPTFAYEHKVFVGPFARRFPKAQVWVAPAQWSFPLNLPPQFFGIFPAGELFDFSEARDRAARARGSGGGVGGENRGEEEEEEEEENDDAEFLEGGSDRRRRRQRQQQQQQQRQRARRRRGRGGALAASASPPPPLPPWADEIDCKVLRPPQLSLSRDVVFSEAALYHRASRTLMVTDAVVYVPTDPPEVVPKWALLALGARDGFLATYLTGGRTKAQVDAEARRGPPGPDTPEARRLGWARMTLLVLYFQPYDLLTPARSFAAISDRLIVGPVVQTLVYSKIPRAVTRWVDGITGGEWRFERVVPCHFAGPVKAGPAEFREAFDFCYEAVAERDAKAKEEEEGGRRRRRAAAGGGGGGGGKGFSDEMTEEGATDAAGGGAADAGDKGPFGGLFAPALKGGRAAVLAGLLAAVTSGGGAKKKRPPPARQLPAEDLGALRSLDSLLVRVGAVFPDAEDRAEAAAAAAAASSKGR